MSDEYTPTTGIMRATWEAANLKPEYFDRWLVQHDEKVMHLAAPDIDTLIPEEPTPELVEVIAKAMSPHLWDGRLEEGLSRISIFTPERLAESVERKRGEAIEKARDYASAVLAHLRAGAA